MIEEEVAARLSESGLTVCTAESCTAGAIGAALTSVPGSSDYYLGGVIAYRDNVKADLLRVPEVDLAAHGAVSESVARAMAQGVLDAFGSDLALATTGILGPGGGSPEKPVGLVYIALAGAAGELACERHVWTGSRLENRQSTVRAALALLGRHLGEEG